MVNIFKAYQNQQDNSLESKVLSASPDELTLMLYEALIKNLLIAKFNIETDKKIKDIEKIGLVLIKSQDILISLRSTLNFDYDMSNNLNEIYSFMLNSLVDINMTKQLGNLDGIIDLAKELRDTWKEVTTL